MQTLYVVYRYGKLGVVDVEYVKYRKSGVDWVKDRDKASGFKLARANAFAKGYRAVKGEDLVIEPK